MSNEDYCSEDYCSFELSKLLKEKGFDEVCTRIYIEIEGRWGNYPYQPTTNSQIKEVIGIMCPTHQMAMKWLREYPRYIFIGIDNQYLFSYEVYHFHIRCNAPKREIDKVGKIDYQTYEEAVEAAIKYSLENLI